MKMLTTTLKEIRAKSPCVEGWGKLLKHLGKTGAEAKDDQSALPVLTVLESNGMDVAIWVLDNCINPYICRLFAADCAERVLHFFEGKHPNDYRPRKAIEAARDPNATSAARAAARAAAWDAARAAAGAAPRNAAWAAAGAAAPWDAAWAAAWGAAWAAPRNAAWAAAPRNAAWAAAWDAARAAQKLRLRQYLEHGEAAKDMPWPNAEQEATNG